MIETLLDACQFVLEDQGEPQSCYWLASQVTEMKLWRASEADVRDALKKDIAKHGASSRFVSLADDEFGLRSWAKQPKHPTPQPLVSVEADLFVALMAFHKKAMTLLRQPALGDENRTVVAERMKALLDNVTAEMKQAQQLNLAERLEAVYDEVKRLADELSKSPDGGSDS